MLTPKQTKFLESYLKTGNATQSYKEAYKASGMSDKTVWEAASRLLKNSKVVARLDEINKAKTEEMVVTSEQITKELQEAYRVAQESGNAAGMVAATMGKAKVNGLILDKQQVTTTTESPESWANEYLAKRSARKEDKELH